MRAHRRADGHNPGGWVNWAGNVTFGAERLHRPSSVPELQRLVAGSTRIRALGTGHSFSRIADSPGDLVSLAGLPRLIDVDTARAEVTVGAGLAYGELAVALNAAGLALHNLASLPHISVAGACATGTHGSGEHNGNLATAVTAIQMVTAGGDLVTASRDSDPARFPGMVVGLGALGIVWRLTLAAEPAFQVRQWVYEDLPWAQVTGNFDEIMASGYSVSLFTDWRHARFSQVWLKRRADAAGSVTAEPRWLGGRLADGPRHPVPGMPPDHCTQQLGVPGPWHERLPHFRLEFTPSAGDELQSEYLLPRASAIDGLEALRPVAGRIAPVLRICEVRAIAADRAWLSPSYQRDTVGVHFTWVNDWAAVAPVLSLIEERLAPLDARPHWGKLFRAGPGAVSGLYPRLGDFRQLMRGFDAAGKFRNDLIDRYLSVTGNTQGGVA
jgi:alditol oxidase